VNERLYKFHAPSSRCSGEAHVTNRKDEGVQICAFNEIRNLSLQRAAHPKRGLASASRVEPTLRYASGAP